MAVGKLSIKKISDSTENIDYINWNILNELIMMELEDSDEDSDMELDITPDGNQPIDTDLSLNGFSRDLLSQLKDQCTETFEKINQLVEGKGNLTEISSLGHFLKGSSSALGLPRIAYYCELIQNIALKKELSKALKADSGNTVASINEEEMSQVLNDELLYQFLSESVGCAYQEFQDTLQKLNVFYKNSL
ncbi:hypothetical protein QEN19_004264 [Hanseniaspora menglaensis]